MPDHEFDFYTLRPKDERGMTMPDHEFDFYTLRPKDAKEASVWAMEFCAIEAQFYTEVRPESVTVKAEWCEYREFHAEAFVDGVCVSDEAPGDRLARWVKSLEA